MDRKTYYQGEEVTPPELNDGFDGAENADRNQNVDLGLVGICSGLSVAQSGTPAITVLVGGPGVAYDPAGQRCLVPGNQTVDCSVDHLGASTAVAGAGKEKIVSIFVKFARANSDPRSDTETPPVTINFVNNESFAFFLVQSAEAVSPTPPSLLSDGILLADVTRTFGQTQILNGNIDITRRQNQIVVSSSPHSVSAPTIQSAISAVLGFLNNHFSGTQDRHPATDVDYAGGPAWADGASNAAGTVEATIDSILARLTSTSAADGTTAIAAKTIASTAAGQGNLANSGTLYNVLQLVRLASNAWYVGSAAASIAWGDTTALAASTVEAAIDGIVGALGASAFGTDGASKIGAGAQGLLNIGTVNSQFGQLQAGTGWKAFANAWSGVNTFDSLAMTASHSFGLSSRSPVRIQRTPILDSSVITFGEAQMAASSTKYQELCPTHGMTLTDVHTHVLPANGTPPAGTKWSVAIIKTAIADGSQTTLHANTVDTTTGSSYGLAHSFSGGTFSEVVDRTLYRYWAKVLGESGTGAANVRLFGCDITQTVTGLEDSP